MNTDNLLLILVFLFTQNKRLMEDVRPVLNFLEEHKEAIVVMERLLTDRKNDAQETPPVDTPYARFKTENGEREEKAEEKTQSPLQGIANKTILRYIQNYLNSQND